MYASNLEFNYTSFDNNASISFFTKGKILLPKIKTSVVPLSGWLFEAEKSASEFAMAVWIYTGCLFGLNPPLIKLFTNNFQFSTASFRTD